MIFGIRPILNMHEDEKVGIIMIHSVFGAITAMVISGNVVWESSHLIKYCFLEDGETACECGELVDCLIDAAESACHCIFKPPTVIPIAIVIRWVVIAIWVINTIMAFLFYYASKEAMSCVYSTIGFLTGLILSVPLVVITAFGSHVAAPDPIIECQTFTQSDDGPLYLGGECSCPDAADQTSCETSATDIGCYCMIYRDVGQTIQDGGRDNFCPSLLRIFTYSRRS